MPAGRLAIADVDAMGREDFLTAFGPVVEHSPWVAEEAQRAAPFGTPAQLRLAFTAALRTAEPAERLSLLHAHPELAGREAEAGELTEASASEQRAARLDRLTPAQLADLREINAAYRERFGFPFISCVREHSVASLLAWGRARLEREPSAEAETALAEVDKIVGLRLGALVEEEAA
jgi:2-oxo-4-hydroxy-4-carboxy-5-ureidoimidazoline decarboxylase